VPLPKIIYLLTDFGFEGQHYVTQLRGVLYKLCPGDCRIEDLTHAVNPFSIIQAEYFLLSTFPYLQTPCIVIAVVDPGVGSSRDIVAIKDTDGNYFIGPNNGVFGRFPPKTRIGDIRKIENPKVIATFRSATFQGRDIMAPAAAALAKGFPFEDLGPQSGPLLMNELPDPEITKYVVTNISAPIIQKSGLEGGIIIRVQVNGVDRVFKYGKTFSDVQAVGHVAYIGSTLFFELAVNCGSAASLFQCKIGDRIRLEWG
jgi:S-adenosylmethionine hydrolase